MIRNLKKMMDDTVSAIDLVLRIARGVDYRTLSQYVIRINKYKDIDDILYEASNCLKDILNYELFGFALKDGSAMDVWIDPRIHGTYILDCVREDFIGQNVDCNIHYFDKKRDNKRHNADTIDVKHVISYEVMDGKYAARLYLLPKRKMLYYHYNIISIIASAVRNALENALNIIKLERVAAIDPLTSCYNRRAFSSYLEQDVAYAPRYRNELSLVMIDIDDFKKINDIHGHDAGDMVLKELSALITSAVRTSDYLVRYGGEEFVLVLPDTTLYNAVQLAEKIRKKIEVHEIKHRDARVTITASFGVACLENKADGKSLLREADERLYQAKATGKNSVVPSMMPCFADKKFVSKEQAPQRECVVHAA